MSNSIFENNGNFNKTDNSINDRTPNEVQELISTEPSPNKIFNCKIDEVHSPEIRKRRFSGQCPSQNRVRSRKKLKSRYSEPSKLSISRVKIERRSQEVKAKKQLTKYYIGNEKCQKEVPSPDLISQTKNINSKPQIDVKKDENPNFFNDIPATSNSTVNDLIRPEITELSEEIRSAIIENVASPCKKVESNSPHKLLTKPTSETNATCFNDNLVQSDCFVSGKFMKQISSEQSDNIGIFCLPESGRRRRQKKYQPGSLLERLHVISSNVEKDKLLFSYEMEAGLRANTGQLVTCDLIVTSLTKHHLFQILHCKSTSKVCEENRHNKISNFEILVISKSKFSNKVNVNSVINLHFPFAVMLDVQLGAVIIFVRNRIVLQQTPVSNQISKARNMTEETIDCLLFSFKNFKFDRLVRVISSNATSCIEECILTQSLVYDATLEVILLHLFKCRYGYILRADTWIGLSCDKEGCYCLIEFFTDRDNLKMSDLLLLEGCMIKIIGVRIIDFTSVDSTLAGLINFVHIDSKNRPFVYKGQVLTLNPEIICLRKSLWPKITSSIDCILIEDKDLKRYSVRVESIRTTSRGLCISDGNSQRTVLLNWTEPPTFSDLKVPFLADAIYYLKGELFADTYSKMLKI